MPPPATAPQPSTPTKQSQMYHHQPPPLQQPPSTKPRPAPFPFEHPRPQSTTTQPTTTTSAPVILNFPETYNLPPQDQDPSRPQDASHPPQPQQQPSHFPPRFEQDPSANIVPLPSSTSTALPSHQTDPLLASATAAAAAALNPSLMNRPNLLPARPVPRIGPEGRPLSTPAAAAAAFMHGTVEKRVACESCGLLFGDVGSLKRHAARSHRAATGKGPVYCSQCNASLKNEQNLRRHIAVCHSGDQENRCDMCSASFSSRGSLKIHQQQVHHVPSAASKGPRGRGRGRGAAVPRGRAGIAKGSKSDKSYVCDMCPDTFKWKGNLKRHRELRHLQLRPFLCRVCNASFGTKSNMRVHLITHSNAAPPPK